MGSLLLCPIKPSFVMTQAPGYGKAGFCGAYVRKGAWLPREVNPGGGCMCRGSVREEIPIGTPVLDQAWLLVQPAFSARWSQRTCKGVSGVILSRPGMYVDHA